MRMRRIPAGECTSKRGRHYKMPYPIWMTEFPITQSLFEQYLGYNPSIFRQNNTWSDLPVENVNWHDAAAFANALSISEYLPTSYIDVDDGRFQQKNSSSQHLLKGYRLPTEEEWFVALYTGETEDSLDDIAWTASNSFGVTHPVGLKKPNKWGLYDMLGNVSCWTSSSVVGMNAFMENDGGHGSLIGIRLVMTDHRGWKND